MGNKRRRNSSSSSESSASSDEDDRIQTKNRPAASTSSSSEDDDEDWNERSTAAKKKPAVKARAIKPQRKIIKPAVKESENESEEDEKEEGEVEDDDDEFNDGYDENLMGDEEDQKRLLQMTEKEREQELFNRSEKREVLKTRFEIEKKLRLQKKKEQSKIISFSDAQLRSNDRRKALENNRKQKDGLKQLKEQREKRKQKAKLRASDVYSSSDDDSDNQRRKSSSSSSSSASSSDESSSDERRKSDEDSKKEIQEFDLKCGMLNSIRLSRFKMSQWCHTPFFRDTVIGCFVRLSIGVNKDKTPIYRVAEIIDVMDGPKAYDLERTKTDKLLKLKHGRDEKSFRIAYVSNTQIAEQEFVDWKLKMEKERLNLPTKKQIDDKLRHIKEAMDYNFKESDIEAIVREKEKYIDVPYNFAMKKTILKKQKDEAEQNGDLALVEELSMQLDEVEEKAKALDYKRTEKISAISYINERNRMKNIVEAEKAILQAREQDRLNKDDDPFKRRKCAPMLVSMTKNKLNTSSSGGGGVEKAAEPTAGRSDGQFAVPNGTSANGRPVPAPTGETIKSSTSGHLEPEQNDLFSAHDFDIQIDFDITSNLTGGSQTSISNSLYNSNLSCSSIASNKSTNRRSLNLEEYKKKKGLI